MKTIITPQPKLLLIPNAKRVYKTVHNVQTYIPKKKYLIFFLSYSKWKLGLQWDFSLLCDVLCCGELFENKISLPYPNNIAVVFHVLKNTQNERYKKKE